MKKMKEQLRRFTLVLLSMLMLTAQISINALETSSSDKNQKIVEKMIDPDFSKVEHINHENKLETDFSLQLKIDETLWEEVKQTGPIRFTLPKSMRFIADKETFIDENESMKIFKDGEGISTSDHEVTLDFKDILNPKTLDVRFRVESSHDVEALKKLDSTDYPIIKKALPSMIAYLESLIKVETPEEETPLVEAPEGTEVEAEKPETGNEDGNPRDPESTGNQIMLEGQISIEFDGDPVAKISNSIGFLSSDNKLNMNNYETEKYSVDFVTKKEGTVDDKLNVKYIVKLDEASIAKILESGWAENVYDFSHMNNGTRVPFVYEKEIDDSLTFPNFGQLHEIISTKIPSAITQIARRGYVPEGHEPGFDEVKMTLHVAENTTMDDGSKDKEPDVFELQSEMGLIISRYIEEELKAGTPIETIQETFREGYAVMTDGWSINNRKLELKPIADIEKEIDFVYDYADFLGLGKDIGQDYAVTPLNPIDNRLTLDSNGIENIPNGFKVAWDGVANTSRTVNMNALNLDFVAPIIVRQSGMSKWKITTKVVVDKYTVLNDGTLVPFAEDPQIMSETENTLNVAIPLPKGNYAIKYRVEQEYEMLDDSIEIEGTQEFTLSTKLNNEYGQSQKHSHDYPSSITISGDVDDQANPTRLRWDVRYNNNELLREEGSGFVFDFDAEKYMYHRRSSSGGNEQSEVIDLTDENVEIKLMIGGKTLEKDGRFEYVINTDKNKIEVKVKKGIKIEKPVTIAITYTYINNDQLKNDLLSYPAIRFDGSAEVKSLNNGQVIEPSKPIEATSTNILKLLDKRPIMVDYRTKEIVWGVNINSATMYRLDLIGLTYADTLSGSQVLEPFNDENQILLYKVDSTKGTSNSDYMKFIREGEKLIRETEAFTEDIPAEMDALLGSKINASTPGSTQTYADVLSKINPSEIAVLTDSSSTYNGQKYIYTEPAKDPGYLSKIAGVIKDGSPGKDGKGKILENASFRLDFVDSNGFLTSGGEKRGDNDAYFLMYKTRLDNDEAIANISNSGRLVYANIVDGTGSGFDWSTPSTESNNNLEDPGKYNSAPKKVGAQKLIVDSEGNLRHGVEWEITFNFDTVREKDIDDYRVRLTDTIDKNINVAGKNLQNKNLYLDQLETLTLVPYHVTKDGGLTEVDKQEQAPFVLNKGTDFTVVEDDQKIEIIINSSELTPKYAYRYKINTLIDTGDSTIPTATDPKANHISTDGSFTNKVDYEVSYNTLDPVGDKTSAEATVELKETNRIMKFAENLPAINLSNQRVLWTTTINETYETLENLVITDHLDGKHSYLLLDPLQTGAQKASLDNFTVSIKNGDSWATMNTADYTLTNKDGLDEPVDSWSTGESGFTLTFNKTINKPVRITYGTYGKVVDVNDRDLYNNIAAKYVSAGRNIDLDIQAKHTIPISNTVEEYKDRKDVELTLRYDKNEMYQPNIIDKGDIVAHESNKKVSVMLYRYDSASLDNNYLYRAASFDENGKLKLFNVEEGNYVVKAVGAPDNYYLSNGLGYRATSNVPAKDKALKISNSNKKNLLFLQVGEQPILPFMSRANEIEEGAIYLNTPVLDVKKQGVLKNANGTDKTEKLKDVTLNFKHENFDNSYPTDASGIIKVGHGSVNDDRVNLGSHIVSEPRQDLNGYVRNRDTIELKPTRNVSGTIEDGSMSGTFSNYKVNIQLKDVDRNTGAGVKNSEFSLEINTGTKENPVWEAFVNAESPHKKSGNIFASNTDTFLIYNLDVGHYRLVQNSAGDDYLLNETPLEFYALGKDELVTEFGGRTNTIELEFTNIKAQVQIKNYLNGPDAYIKGSIFEILNKDNVVVDTLEILDENAGISANIAPGEYTLRQKSTTENRPVNQKTVAFTIAGVEVEDNTTALDFQNHLGTTTVLTHTHLSSPFTIKSMAVDYNGTKTPVTDVNTIKNQHSGISKLVDVVIDENLIYITTNPQYEIPATYLESSELDTEVHLYATQATLPFDYIDGDDASVVMSDKGQFKLENTDTRDVPFAQDGTDEFVRVIPGTYKMTQEVAVSGYGLNTKVIENITIPTTLGNDLGLVNTTDHSVQIHTMPVIHTNHYRGRVVLTKTSSETQESLPNVTFNLGKGGSDDALMTDLVTNAQGQIELDKLAPGDYWFEETKGDGNHTVIPEKVPFTIDDRSEDAYEPKQVGVDNHTAKAIFKNTDPGGEKLYTDGIFKLEKDVAGVWEPVDGYQSLTVTGDNDFFEIASIKPGDYRLLQVQAPTGTVQNTFEQTFNIPDYQVDKTRSAKPVFELEDYINYTGTMTIDLVNRFGATDLMVKAMLVDNAGLELGVVEQSGTQLIIKDLAPGTYEVKVLEIEKGIIVDDSVIFEIPTSSLNDDDVHKDDTIRMTDAEQHVVLNDGDNQTPLNTGSFTLNDDPTLEIKDDAGIVFTMMGPGTHTVLQTKAAEGMILNTLNTQDVTIERRLSDFPEAWIDNTDFPYVKLPVMEFENYRQDVMVHKTDDKNNVLEDVTFGLNDSLTAITDHEGNAHFKQLSPGQYELKETKGLEGYQVLDETFDLEIQAEHPGKPETILLNVINEKIIIPEVIKPEVVDPKVEDELPPAGVDNIIVEISLLLIALGVVLKQRSKRRQIQ